MNSHSCFLRIREERGDEKKIIISRGNEGNETFLSVKMK
jgi:hypothetical protein